MTIEVRAATDADHAPWFDMRQALWPADDPSSHYEDILQESAAGPFCSFIAWRDGVAAGFAEATVRSHVDGSPATGAAYLEGIWVAPEARGTGVASALLGAVEAWAAALGCTALGSDALLDNEAGNAWHRARGFAEVDRAVHYIKPIKRP